MTFGSKSIDVLFRKSTLSLLDWAVLSEAGSLQVLDAGKSSSLVEALIDAALAVEFFVQMRLSIVNARHDMFQDALFKVHGIASHA